MLSPCIKHLISSYYTLHDSSLSQIPAAIKSEAKRHLDKLRDPLLRAEALRDHDTVTFDTASDLQHGDTIVTYSWMGWGLMQYEHWWLFDQRNNQVIGMKMPFDESNSTLTLSHANTYLPVVSLELNERLAMGGKKGCCTSPLVTRLGSGVLNSRGFYC